MKHSFLIATTTIMFIYSGPVWMSSCHKSANPAADSATFLFHLHTQIADSTIGGNTDGSDSNTTGSSSVIYPWYFDSLGRHIQLRVPQFFISGIMLQNENGTMLTLKNTVVLKGLDSEDYVLCKVPVGTYTSAIFTVGLTNADSAQSPTVNFLTGNGFPGPATMWNSTSGDYYGMVINGLYDTSVVGIAGGVPVNPIPFALSLPNSATIRFPVSLPVRTAPASQPQGVYLATAGSYVYIHLLCDYGRLLTAINLRTSNQTSSNPLIADSISAHIPYMFRYEE